MRWHKLLKVIELPNFFIVLKSIVKSVKSQQIYVLKYFDGSQSYDAAVANEDILNHGVFSVVFLSE